MSVDVGVEGAVMIWIVGFSVSMLRDVIRRSASTLRCCPVKHAIAGMMCDSRCDEHLRMRIRGLLAINTPCGCPVTREVYGWPRGISFDPSWTKVVHGDRVSSDTTGPCSLTLQAATATIVKSSKDVWASQQGEPQ